MKKSDWITVLIFINILLSAYLIYSESRNYGYCVIGSTCESVQNSQYAYIFGVPVIWIGFISFVAILFLFYSKKFHKVNFWLYHLGITIAAIYAVYFISIQAFVLRKLCSTCMVIDTLTIVVALLSISCVLEKRKR